MERTKEIEQRLEAAKGKVFDVIFPETCEREVRVAIVHSTSDAYYLLDRVKSMEAMLQEVRSNEMFTNDCRDIDGKDCRCDMCKDIDALLAPPATERSK